MLVQRRSMNLLSVLGLAVFLLISCGPKMESPPPPSTGAVSHPPLQSVTKQAPESQGTMSEIDRVLESMKLGNIAFNCPTSIDLKDIAQIELRLSMDQSVEELQKAITSAGQKEGRQVRISDVMEARLTGPAFQITAQTPREQAIASRGVTQWRWDIKPTSTGQQRLHLTLSAVLYVNGQRTRKAIETFDKTIDVWVPAGRRVSGFLSNNWQWGLTVVLIPVGGWCWKWLRKRRRKPKGGAK